MIEIQEIVFKKKLNKHFLLCICCILQLPQQISLELFKFSSFGLTLLDNEPVYFQLIKEIENYIKNKILIIKR